MSSPDRRYWRWAIAGLLLLATTINYMDRVTLSSAAKRVLTSLQINEEQYGDIELAFGWGFGLGSVVFGYLADRFRIYWLYPAVLAAWSLMGMLSGWAHNYTELLVCRSLLGFFEAAHWPCALKTTFRLLNEQERTLGNSVLQSGASVGAIITPQVMKLFLSDTAPDSWRSAFVVVGGVGLLWCVVWLVALRKTELRDEVPVVVKQEDAGLWGILMSRSFWAVALLILGAQTVWHIYRAWLTLFLQKGRGYADADALDFTSIYYIATDVGCILSGVLALWLARAFSITPHHSRRISYMLGCCLTSCGVLLPSLPAGWGLQCVLLVVGAGALALFPCYYSFVQELSPRYVGRLTGILSAWVWAVTSPLHKIFGEMVTRTGSYDLGLVVAALAPWLGVLSMALLWKKQDHAH